ncbi:MAG: hypothetical protein M3Q87_04940 [Actinomycetota bacterium]|nr:hypothetical protein [Actinomycetota bacterium]
MTRHPLTVRLERLDSVGLPHARAVLYAAIDSADGDVHVDLDEVVWVDR